MLPSTPPSEFTLDTVCRRRHYASLMLRVKNALWGLACREPRPGKFECAFPTKPLAYRLIDSLVRVVHPYDSQMISAVVIDCIYLIPIECGHENCTVILAEEIQERDLSKLPMTELVIIVGSDMVSTISIPEIKALFPQAIIIDIAVLPGGNKFYGDRQGAINYQGCLEIFYRDNQ